MTQAPTVAPFRGLLYSTKKIPNLAEVVAPPYDVISPEFQRRLYDRHPHNIVRLILAQESPGGEDRYQSAARDLQKWIQEGVLVRDPAPAYYVYEQEFQVGEERVKRRGFFGLRRLEPFGSRIRRHEQTLSAPKEDRLRLIQGCRANLSPVFSLYEDPSGEMRKLLQSVTDPAVDFADEDQVYHRMWRVTEAKVVQAISSRVGESPLLVADGHHRFETALNFRNQLRKKHPEAPENASFEYVMMFFLEMGDPGLQIWPTHRILSYSEIGPVLARLRERFEVESFRSDHPREFLDALNTLATRGFGLVLPRDNRFHLVADSKNEQALDLLLVHEGFFRKMLGMTPEAEREALSYTKSADEVFSAVQTNHDRLGVLLKPPTPKEIFDVVKEGRVLPPKSTYFFPKLASGLVLHPLSLEEKVII